MLWFVIWVALVLGALAVLGWIGYVLFRKGVALVRELGEAADLLARAADQVERLQRPASPSEPAVFADPHELRRARQRARKQRHSRRTMRTSRAGG